MKVKGIKLNKIFEKARMNMDIIALPFSFVIVVILMTLGTSFRFLSSANISSMAFQLPELGLLALAMMLAMTTGGIDLSIISTANFTGVIMALLLTKVFPFDEKSGFAIILMILLVVCIGLVIALILGLVNGLLIAYVEVSPVLVTLSTMILYEGLTLSITKGRPISGLPESFTIIGNNSLVFIPIPFIIFSICAFIIRLKVKKSPIGRYQVLMGSNKRAVEYSGIDIRKIIIKTYMMSSLLAGVASIIMISRFNSANARFGTSYLLLSVLISVLGGTDPDGGYVRVGGVIVAIFTLQALNSGINALGISQFIALALWGVLLVLIILYRRYSVNKRNKWLAKISKEMQEN